MHQEVHQDGLAPNLSHLFESKPDYAIKQSDLRRVSVLVQKAVHPRELFGSKAEHQDQLVLTFCWLFGISIIDHMNTMMLSKNKQQLMTRFKQLVGHFSFHRQIRAPVGCMCSKKLDTYGVRAFL